MTQTQQNERIVQGLVKERAEVYNSNGEAEFKVSITSPFFDSPKNFPQIIYIPQDEGQDIRPGGTHLFVLRAAGKVKDDYDGNKPWHWRWRYVRMAGEDEQPAQPKPQAPAQGSAPQQQGPPAFVSDHDRQESIERQVCLKAASDMAANGVLIPDDEQGIVDAVLAAADRFRAWFGQQQETSE